MALGAYALSYRRCFAKSAESVANFAVASAAIPHRKWRRLSEPFLRSPFESACFRFTLKTLFRSENHMLITGGFTGVGIVLASQTLFEARGESRAQRRRPG